MNRQGPHHSQATATSFRKPSGPRRFWINDVNAAEQGREGQVSQRCDRRAYRRSPRNSRRRTRIFGRGRRIDVFAMAATGDEAAERIHLGHGRVEHGLSHDVSVLRRELSEGRLPVDPQGLGPLQADVEARVQERGHSADGVQDRPSVNGMMSSKARTPSHVGLRRSAWMSTR